jgi:hypothetical protein
MAKATLTRLREWTKPQAKMERASEAVPEAGMDRAHLPATTRDGTLTVAEKAQRQ